MKPLPLAGFTLYEFLKTRNDFAQTFYERKKSMLKLKSRMSISNGKAFVSERCVPFNPRKQERTWNTTFITENML